MWIVKLAFARTRTAMAQAVSAEEAQLRFMPPGATPPLILAYSASSIPVLQLGISSPVMSEQALNDAASGTGRVRCPLG